MKTALIAGYPKSGNTLLGETLNIAGNVASSYEYYALKNSNARPSPNNLFAEPVCTIKTHEMNRPSINLHSLYYGPVASVVTIVRNPFETLLSALNFFRVVYKTYSGLPASHEKSLRLLIPDYEITPDFPMKFTIESLRDQGLLSAALTNFAEMGTNLPHFYDMSGPWNAFASSYDNCGVPVLNLKYEDLASESISSSPDHSVCSQKLSEFWSCDFHILKKAFIDQTLKVKHQKSRGNIFFPKAFTGYWREFFSISDCRKFADTYHRSLVLNGYQQLLDELFSC